ncbi:AI-2E family transporter [uncultured Campylobacter sp.]|uniref:AI-2E family transporter n=1 Tax=uncultured Campylobacter sp. TaxID=218934 RepID=UPI002629F1D1|nr:AI-2E family transporter [uncultured Campylobacter sp.]
MKLQMSLMSVACVVIILAGLKAAQAIVVPFLLAIFITVLVSPLVLYVQKIRVGRVFSFLIITFAFVAIIVFFGAVIFDAIKEFSARLPELQAKFEEVLGGVSAKLSRFGIELNAASLGIDPSEAAAQLSALLRKTGSIVSTGFFIFIMVSFMVFESSVIDEKIRYFSQSSRATHTFVKKFASSLKKYLLIKTIASACTGALIGLGLWALGVPYAALWGILAFVLNFIPTIGSIVAVFPTLFVTLATMDISSSIWTIAIYLVVNVAIGNIIEPRFLGQGLGLSTISVLAGLLLWGFVLGIGGLFLAVPLTMSLQIALASNDKTKSIATLLGNKVEK